MTTGDTSTDSGPKEAGTRGFALVGSASYVALGWIYKTSVGVVMLPITYRVIAYIKRREPTYQPAV